MDSSPDTDFTNDSGGNPDDATDNETGGDGSGDPNNPTDRQKEKSLDFLMFLKKKLDGKIKGIGCDDGRKQREKIKKEYASSPTVAIKYFMLSCIIYAKGNRDVEIVGILGSFLHVDMDEYFIMTLSGKWCNLLCKYHHKCTESTWLTSMGRLCSM